MASAPATSVFFAGLMVKGGGNRGDVIADTLAYQNNIGVWPAERGPYRFDRVTAAENAVALEITAGLVRSIVHVDNLFIGGIDGSASATANTIHIYSLFENHFDQKPVGFTPLDGAGTDNDFVAGPDGRAVKTLTAPAPLTHDNAVLVVYHSDGKSHGTTRGMIGVDAHHQPIARPQ
jgi:hypothetical protein